jgi:biopolymer transport protein ExbB
MDIQERLTAFAQLGATWVMWLLIILSVIGLAFVLERLYVLVTSTENFGQLKETVLAKLRAGDWEGAALDLRKRNSFEARIVLAGVESHLDGPHSAEERMAGESSLARLAMQRNLAFLGTVGNNAPFVGLLGTVIGIINAFQELDQSGGQVSAGLMAEIGEALVATAIGLLVALPAVAFFNAFNQVIKGRLGRADALGREVLGFMLSRRLPENGPYRSGGGASPGSDDAEGGGDADADADGED